MDARHFDAGFGDEAMILKGSQRAGASALADHLTNTRDNDHVNILELRGFVSDRLHGALLETHAISKATRCQQFMFSLSLNPPQNHIASEQDFLTAADRAEEHLGLTGQPRAVILHEKEGRRHAHVVWSRIDPAHLRAINLPHFKRKLMALSKELYLDHGWDLPDGLRTHGGKSPLNFTLAEWQQAKRLDLDPREIKQLFRKAWDRSDSLKGLQNALEERGYFLAKGDRRGFVALDIQCTVYSLPRWTGLKAKEVKERLGSPDQLPSVSERQAEIKGKVTDQMRGYIAQVKAKHRKDAEPLLQEKTDIIAQHRAERQRLHSKQQKRWRAEAKARSERLNGGLRGLFDRFTGTARKTRDQNALEAYHCAKRDQAQRDQLVVDQMQDRRELQQRFIQLRDVQKREQATLARDISAVLRMKSGYAQAMDQARAQRMERRRDRGFEIS
ncbi:relaxase/mobilization nuclease domain-containing protein [Pseudaestuariivita rosea]|uniref:relaxase/mobilization nuclease domain-containing protein n=1 Tax=Pseudaestuariivita rosea TaxID=2763263 RepID=UPI001F443C11|nr:relaxase/mobilization nuclease domain-containing protein [Pseudaestuariivita rosea]